LIVFLGAGLRIYDLGRKSLWHDEASSVYFSDVLIPDIAEMLTNAQGKNEQLILQQVMHEWAKREVGNPPLYYVFLRFWMAIGRDELTVRLFSVLAGILSIPMLYWLSKAMFNETVGVFSALLLATSPLHVDYSQQARMYPLITLLILVSVYCTIRFLKKDTWIWRIGYVLCMAASLYTHYITVFALVMQNTIVLIYCWQQREKRRFLIWSMMQLSVLLLYVPWIPVVLYQTAAMGEGNSPADQQVSLFEHGARLLATFSLGRHGGDLPWWAIAIGLPGFLMFMLYGLFAPGINSSARGKYPGWIIQEAAFCLLYLLFALLGALLLSGIRPYPTRLALFSLPAYYILVARGIERIRLGGKTKLAVCVALAAVSLFIIVTNIYQRDSPEDWRGVANYILSKSQSDDIVVLHASYTHTGFNYYATGRIPIYTGFGRVSDQLQNLPELTQEIVQGHGRLWLVLSRMRYVDPDWTVKKYLDAHYQMLEERQFQGMDGVLLYRLEE
jgi:mannosyltransferase